MRSLIVIRPTVEQSPIRLKTLGSFTVVDPPTLAATKLGVKERALLAFLANKIDTVVYRDDVSGLLWANVDDQRRKHSLSQALSSINKALPGWVICSRGTIKLVLPKTSIDLHCVHRLLNEGNIVEAYGFLDGRFLADVNLNDADFADWKDAVNFEFYRDVEIKSLRLLADNRALPTEARHQLTRRLMSVISFSESLRDLESQLSHELLAQAIKSPKVENTPDAEKNAQLGFVGRADELSRIIELWNSSVAGTGQFVFLEGGAGVGKTRLLQEFTKTSGTEARVITIRCYQAERHIGLNGLVDLIQSIVTESTFESLPPVFASALADVVGRDVSTSYALPELSTQGSQRRLFEAVLRVIQAELVKAPLIIIFEDLHWADQSTLAFLHLLARRLRARPAMVIAAARPSHRLQSFSDSNVITRLPIGELTPVEIDKLKNDPKLGEACRSASTSQLTKLTAGNAFLLTEYLQTFNETDRLSAVRRMLSSHGTRDFIRVFLAGLSRSSISLISALAVIGRPIGANRLRHLIRHTEEAFSKSIRQLTARRIITGDRVLAFRHDLIREGVYRRIPPIRRQLLHRRVAMLFKANGESYGTVARHFYLAGENEPAHEHATLAVAAADARLALNEAAQFVKLALRTAPNRVIRAQLHQDLAQRSFRLRHYRDALHHIDSALDERVGMKAEEKAALTLLQLEILITIGRISTHELAAHLAEFEKIYLPSLNNDLRYGILRLLIRSSAMEGDTTRCSEYARDLVNYAANWGGLLSAQALSLAARIRSYTTSYIEALPWAERAERMLASDVIPEIAADVLTNIGSVYSDAGEYQRALRLYNNALGLIQASGALHIWPRTATHKHMLLVEMGLLGDARALAAEISAAWNEDDAHQHISTLEGNIALMYYHLQDYERSAVHATNSLSNRHNLMLYSHRLTATALIGIAHLEAGRLTAANKSAVDLLDQIGPCPKRLGDYSFVEIFLARWHVRCGRLKDAAEGLEAALKDCVNRDVGSYLRMKLEYARLLRRGNPALAATLAKAVNEAAVKIGARPTAEQSELLVARFRG